MMKVLGFSFGFLFITSVHIYIYNIIYIAKAKLAMNQKLSSFCERPVFKQSRFTQFQRRQVTEARILILNNYQGKFHPNKAAKDMLVCFADWSGKTPQVP